MRPSPGRNKLVLTAEQQAVVIADAPVLKIEAYAGASKTTCLVERARHRPNRRILYLAFNRSMADEARGLFPSNTQCKTGHGLGYAKVGAEYAGKGKLQKSNIAPYQLRRTREFNTTSSEHLEAVFATVSNYLNSADDVISTEHLPRENKILVSPEEARGGRYDPNGLQYEQAIRLANKLWSCMKDLANPSINITHDGYLKLFQLSKPVLSYDEIQLDEGQDSNPVILDIVMRQRGRAKITLVGDKHQAIYGFRNAVNAMDSVQADITLPLSQSFRFGPAVAAQANALLQLKGEKIPLRGFEQKQSTVGQFSPGEKHAVISRTNGGIIQGALEGVEKGQKLAFVGGIDSYPFGLLMDVYHLYCDRPRSIEDPEIRSYDNFDRLRAKTKKAKAGQEKILVSLVEQYAHRIPEMLEQVRNSTTGNLDAADVVLTTVHKAKGLGFDNVRLSEDFFAPFDGGGTPHERLEESAEEINLLYVAATRVKKSLWPNSMFVDVVRFTPDYLRSLAQTQPGQPAHGKVEGYHLRDIGNVSLFIRKSPPQEWGLTDRVFGASTTIGAALESGRIGQRALTVPEAAGIRAVFGVLTAENPALIVRDGSSATVDRYLATSEDPVEDERYLEPAIR